MIRILSFIWIFVLISGCKIYFGDLVIQTTADLDAFAARGYTYVLGNVRIENTNLTNLEGLNNITSVAENVWIGSWGPVVDDSGGIVYTDYQGNDALTSLDGLENLHSVGEDLYIYYNEALPKSLACAFASGVSVGGEATVEGNFCDIDLCDRCP